MAISALSHNYHFVLRAIFIDYRTTTFISLLMPAFSMFSLTVPLPYIDFIDYRLTLINNNFTASSNTVLTLPHRARDIVAIDVRLII
jgi:hypothetical protein